MMTSNVFKRFATVAEMSQMPQRRCDCQAGVAIPLFRARDYISGEPFEIVRCSSCGLAFTHPVPADSEWPRYYPDSYYGAADANRFPALIERLQNALYASRARKIESLAGGKPGRVLDIGCGRGFLLRAFQQRRWEVTGTEMSPSATAYAREKLKLPVHVGKLQDLKLPESSFNAVVMWHVLEHMDRANDVLDEVCRLLRPGGVLLVAVPNFSSVEARLARDKWFHLDVPRHLTHFPRGALKRRLEQSGFRIERVSSRSPEYDFFSAMQSMLNRIGLQHNWLYNFVRRGGAKIRGDGGPMQAVVHLAALPIASVAGCLATIAGGSTLIVYARKA
jgi:SAM-dependent methyltransferase